MLNYIPMQLLSCAYPHDDLPLFAGDYVKCSTSDISRQTAIKWHKSGHAEYVGIAKEKLPYGFIYWRILKHRDHALFDYYYMKSERKNGKKEF